MRSNRPTHSQATRAAFVLFALGLAPLQAGCGSILADRCDAICECENCGERDFAECEIRVGADLDVASAYGCYDELEAFYECQLDWYRCDGRSYRDNNERCNNERDRFNRCLEVNSRREGGPYNRIRD